MEAYVHKNGRYPHDAVMAMERQNGTVTYVAIGGGFGFTMTEIEFDRLYRPVTTDDIGSVKFASVVAKGDWNESEHPGWPAYDCGSLNGGGWSMPVFERDVAEAIFKSMDEPWRYDEDRDTFIWTNDGDEFDEAIGFDIVVNGQTKHVYELGSGDWMWSVE